MRIHLLEHEIEGISRNFLNGARKKDCSLDRTFVCGTKSLPAIFDFDLLIICFKRHLPRRAAG